MEIVFGSFDLNLQDYIKISWSPTIPPDPKFSLKMVCHKRWSFAIFEFSKTAGFILHLHG